MTRYKVIIASRVDNQLLEHFRFIANVSIPAAKRFRDEFGNTVKEISENPYQFPIDADLNLPEGMYRKAFFSRWYKIHFTIKDETVFIDAVADCRQG